MTDKIILSRDDAIKKIREGITILDSLGIAESFGDIVLKEAWHIDLINGNQPEYIELFKCAICDINHNLILSIKKDTSIQYSLIIEIEEKYNLSSFIDKLKKLYYTIKSIFIHKKYTNEFLLSNEELYKFKDLLKKIP